MRMPPVVAVFVTLGRAGEPPTPLVVEEQQELLLAVEAVMLLTEDAYMMDDASSSSSTSSSKYSAPRSSSLSSFSSSLSDDQYVIVVGETTRFIPNGPERNRWCGRGGNCRSGWASVEVVVIPIRPIGLVYREKQSYRKFPVLFGVAPLQGSAAGLLQPATPSPCLCSLGGTAA
jgi:hypothetical protein